MAESSTHEEAVVPHGPRAAEHVLELEYGRPVEDGPRVNDRTVVAVALLVSVCSGTVALLCFADILMSLNRVLRDVRAGEVPGHILFFAVGVLFTFVAAMAARDVQHRLRHARMVGGWNGIGHRERLPLKRLRQR